MSSLTSQLQQLQQPHPQIPIYFHTTSGARLVFTLQANLAAATAVNTNKLAEKIIFKPVTCQHKGQRYIDNVVVVRCWSLGAFCSEVGEVDMEEYKLYSVERDGKSLKLKSRQLNIAILSKLFHLFPESIVLVSNDSYVETPDEDGDFIGVDDLPTWTVSGDSTKPTTPPVTTQPVTTPYAYQPIVKGKGRASRWTPTFTT